MKKSIVNIIKRAQAYLLYASIITFFVFIVVSQKHDTDSRATKRERPAVKAGTASYASFAQAPLWTFMAPIMSLDTPIYPSDSPDVETYDYTVHVQDSIAEIATAAKDTDAGNAAYGNGLNNQKSNMVSSGISGNTNSEYLGNPAYIEGDATTPYCWPGSTNDTGTIVIGGTGTTIQILVGTGNEVYEGVYYAGTIESGTYNADFDANGQVSFRLGTVSQNPPKSVTFTPVNQIATNLYNSCSTCASYEPEVVVFVAYNAGLGYGYVTIGWNDSGTRFDGAAFKYTITW